MKIVEEPLRFPSKRRKARRFPYILSLTHHQKSGKLALECHPFNFLPMRCFGGNAFWAMGVLALFFACGPEGHAQKAESSAAEYCPVLPDERIDPSIYVDYQGRRIYFCCIHCKQEFSENPADYLPGPGAVKELEPRGPTLTGARAWGNKLIAYAGKFHPLVVHFPIALLLAAFAAEALSWKPRWDRLKSVARFNLWAGALGAVLAVGLGWAAASGSPLEGEMGAVLERHRWLGTMVAVFAIGAVWLEGRCRDSKRWKLGAVLFVLVVIVGIAGHLGGTLVYGKGYLDW